MYSKLDEVKGRARKREIEKAKEYERILSTNYSQNPYPKNSARARLWSCEKKELEEKYKDIIRQLS